MAWADEPMAEVTTNSACNWNGQPIPCDQMFAMLAPFMIPVILIWLCILVFFIIVMWRIFTKAGKPGWAALIPIYNTIVLIQIVNKPIWWIFLFFIPIANIVFIIIVYHRLSLSFGKDAGFTVGLIFLGIIFFPILAFGSAQYRRLPD
jgi:hypothetical protein